MDVVFPLWGSFCGDQEIPSPKLCSPASSWISCFLSPGNPRRASPEAARESGAPFALCLPTGADWMCVPLFYVPLEESLVLGLNRPRAPIFGRQRGPSVEGTDSPAPKAGKGLSIHTRGDGALRRWPHPGTKGRNAWAQRSLHSPQPLRPAGPQLKPARLREWFRQAAKKLP